MNSHISGNLNFQMALSWKLIAQNNIPLSDYRRLCLQDQLRSSEELATAVAGLIATTRKDNTPKSCQILLDLLGVQKACARHAITTIRALSPIQWIPNEILAEIFFHCIPDDYHFSLIQAPLSLCLVCTVWRTLALSNRGLWKKLSFWSPVETKRDVLCYPTRLVNQWLSRSGTLPLQLFFERGMTRAHVKTFAELVLLEYYTRCQHLDFSISQTASRGLINFINLPPGSLSGLKCLTLDGLDEAAFLAEEDDDEDDEDDEDTLAPMITTFQASPLLRKLATSTLDFAFRTGTDEIQFNILVIPWLKLTHLLITSFIDVGFFVPVLAECLSLQFLRVSLSLNIDGEPSDIGSADLPNHVILSSLAAIYISLDGGLTFPSEMDIFRLPVLTTAHFRRYRDDPREADRFSWTKSIQFCNQLGHLQQLSLTGHVGPPEQIIFLLRYTSAITSLKMDIFTDYAAILPTIFPLGMFSPLPALTSLELHLEKQELCYPRGPPNNIFEFTRNGVALRRMRALSLESSQPCIFRLREMIESTQSCPLHSLRLFYLRLLPPRDKSIDELQKQFRTSTLTTQFEKKGMSSRVGSDQMIMENHCTSTSYTLY